jgi:hypothetical protein
MNNRQSTIAFHSGLSKYTQAQKLSYSELMAGVCRGFNSAHYVSQIVFSGSVGSYPECISVSIGIYLARSFRWPDFPLDRRPEFGGWGCWRSPAWAGGFAGWRGRTARERGPGRVVRHWWGLDQGCSTLPGSVNRVPAGEAKRLTRKRIRGSANVRLPGRQPHGRLP